MIKCRHEYNLPHTCIICMKIVIPAQWRIQTFTDGGANRELCLSMLCIGIFYCGKPICVRPHRFTSRKMETSEGPSTLQVKLLRFSLIK